MKPKALKITLLVIQFFICVTAIFGGIYLLATDGGGMSKELLDGSPFRDFTIPAFILIIVVGGVHLSAAIAILRCWSSVFEWSASAGFGMCIWIFVEVCILRESHILHFAYFGLGLAQLIVVLIMMKRRFSAVSTPEKSN